MKTTAPILTLILVTSAALPAQTGFPETITVRSDGSLATSNNILVVGSWYRIDVSGTITIPVPADADYYSTTTTWSGGSIVDGNGVADHGVEVNGVKYHWGPFDSNHTYSITIPGTGAQAKFRYLDSTYGDNSGSFQVVIHDVIPQESLTVPSRGNVTSSTVLRSGLIYSIMVKGTITIPHPADAEFYSPGGSWTAPDLYDGNLPIADHGVVVDGVKIRWGVCDPVDHTYVAKYIGTGNTVTFGYADTNYRGNLGDFTVEFAPESEYGYGSGCPGTSGIVPALSLSGCFSPADQESTFADNQVTVTLGAAAPTAPTFFYLSSQKMTFLVGSTGTCAISVGMPAAGPIMMMTDGSGRARFTIPIPPRLLVVLGVDNVPIRLQALVFDAGAPTGIGASASNAVGFNIR